MTTAQNLFGESLFLDFMIDPSRATEILHWSTDVSIALVEHFAKLAKLTGREVNEFHVGECSACMVSSKLFEQFVVPTLSCIGRRVGAVRLHSCGTSDHLLTACQKIENLVSLDVGGGTSVAAIREYFGDELVINIAPLVEDLLSDTPNALLNWVDRVLEQNADGPLNIGFHLESGYNLDHLRAVRDLL